MIEYPLNTSINKMRSQGFDSCGVNVRYDVPKPLICTVDSL